MGKKSTNIKKIPDPPPNDPSASPSTSEKDHELISKCLEVQIAQENCICRICHKVFRDNYHRKRHEQIHVKAGEILPETLNLNEKVKTPVKEKKIYACQICKKVFQNNWKLKRHENVHIQTGELPPRDPVQELETQVKSKNILSEKNVSPPRVLTKNYECKECHKTFKDSWKLRRHERVHEKERNN